MSHLSSHGRGGAGNIVDSAKSPKLQPQDLQTPHLRTSVVTTGRGGQGNMARNKDAAETRVLQDVQPVVRRESHGAVHGGRGGAGNILAAESAEAKAAEEEMASGASAISDDSSPRASTSTSTSRRPRSPPEQERGLAAKGKDWLLGKMH